MVFRFTLPFDAPVDIDLVRLNDEVIARAAIGYDDDTDMTYSALVALSPLPGGHRELVFTVVGVGGSDDDIVFFDGLASRAVLTDRGRRHAVRMTICNLVARLLVDMRAPASYR